MQWTTGFTTNSIYSLAFRRLKWKEVLWSESRVREHLIKDINQPRTDSLFIIIAVKQEKWKTSPFDPDPHTALWAIFIQLYQTIQSETGSTQQTWNPASKSEDAPSSSCKPHVNEKQTCSAPFKVGNLTPVIQSQNDQGWKGSLKTT